MKILATLSMLLMTVSTPAVAVIVETAAGDWKALPQLSQRGSLHLSTKMQAKLFEIAQSQKCPSIRVIGSRLDFRIGFAVQYAPDKSLARLVLPRLDCPDAEGVTAGALLAMIQAGDYAPAGQSPAGWYQGTFAFVYGGAAAGDAGTVQTATQSGAVKGPNPNETVCETVEALGTRLVSKRVCMTRAQWAEQRRLDRQEVDRIQTQRGCKDTNSC